ncbi:hypothetical protein KR222_005185 [Zaprionus bogoriensis]|nr:hypothetical protein KR222_005185 [Zaprionus bogoriensis]
MGTATMRVLCVMLAALCVNQLQAASIDQPPASGVQTGIQTSRYSQRGQYRHNNNGAVSATSAQQHSEIKDLMSNLQDRVAVLATLDEDQRNRLEVIDKKVDKLLESSAGRMESLRTQQMNFQQRLDTFEHTQRMTRRTLDELKELSRSERAAPQEYPSASQNVANNMGIFNTNFSYSTETSLDVPKRLDALATLLASVSFAVKDAQDSIDEVRQSNIKIQQRLAHQSKNRAQQASAPLPTEHATSCQQSYLAKKGILQLKLSPEAEPFYVRCADDDWTVILNRTSDDLSFERSWLDYKEGFGNLASDFFIGLDKLHALTSSQLYELRIDLENFRGDVAYALYDAFAISGERELYALSLLGQFRDDVQPSAGDSLSYQAGAKFSTFDNDNDNCVECNCAQRLRGGGWFNACSRTNVMGKYYGQQRAEQAGETGIYWDTFQGPNYSLRSVRMLIRPVSQEFTRR